MQIHLAYFRREIDLRATLELFFNKRSGELVSLVLHALGHCNCGAGAMHVVVGIFDLVTWHLAVLEVSADIDNVYGLVD